MLFRLTNSFGKLYTSSTRIFRTVQTNRTGEGIGERTAVPAASTAPDGRGVIFKRFPKRFVSPPKFFIYRFPKTSLARHGRRVYFQTVGLSTFRRSCPPSPRGWFMPVPPPPRRAGTFRNGRNTVFARSTGRGGASGKLREEETG